MIQRVMERQDGAVTVEGWQGGAWHELPTDSARLTEVSESPGASTRCLVMAGVPPQEWHTEVEKVELTLMEVTPRR